MREGLNRLFLLTEYVTRTEYLCDSCGNSTGWTESIGSADSVVYANSVRDTAVTAASILKQELPVSRFSQDVIRELMATTPIWQRFFSK